ncbi:MAG: response regulator [Bacteroidota bacterium]
MSYRILIVEDEILIGDTLARYLYKKNYEVVGIATSYEEAQEIFEQELPDLILLDIHLNSQLNGIDFASFVQVHPASVPFIYLTSQTDSKYIQAAKNTFPAGYLSKPIQIGSLFATIEIAMHSHSMQDSEDELTIQLSDGKKNILVPINDILFLQADHVYVHVYLDGQASLMPRNALTEILELLPTHQFFQTHRSYAVNLHHVTNWDKNYVYIQGHSIPLSRSRRKALQDSL